jgi:ABC-type bacteriocin/lantibiotic exporter with double-glycine peptidase domain
MGTRREWEVARFLLVQLRLYRRTVGLVCLMEIADVFVGAIAPWFTKYLLDDAFPNRNFALALALFGGFVAVDLLNRCFDVPRYIFDAYLRMRISTDLRRRFHRQLQALSMRFLDSRPVGEHMYRVLTTLMR